MSALPGCDYQGYEFGAGRYPDSVCIEGSLHDADDSPEPGMVNLNDEDIPCPICRPEDARNWHADRANGVSRRKALSNAASLVNDIRKNRDKPEIDFYRKKSSTKDTQDAR